MSADDRILRATIVGANRSQHDLNEFLGTSDLDVTAPSELPGWTIGHVLTHLARNADSHVEMLEGGPQYGGDEKARNAAIDAGAGRPMTDLVDDVVSSAQRLSSVWADHGFDGEAQTMRGTAPMSMLPLLRWREVEWHWVDLGAGHQLSDLPADYVRHDLRGLEMVYRSRLPMGLSGFPPPVLEREPRVRLAWLLGRAEIDGVRSNRGR